MNRPSGLKANRPLLFLPAAKTAVWACFYSDIRIQCIVLSIIHAEVRIPGASRFGRSWAIPAGQAPDRHPAIFEASAKRK